MILLLFFLALCILSYYIFFHICVKFHEYDLRVLSNKVEAVSHYFFK